MQELDVSKRKISVLFVSLALIVSRTTVGSAAVIYLFAKRFERRTRGLVETRCEARNEKWKHFE